MLIKIHLKPTVMVHTPITLFWRDVTRFLLLCPAQRALSDDVVWCLSVAYIGPKSRTERPRKTTIGTEVAHVTRDSDTTFKVKSQRSRSPGRFGWLYWQANMDIELVTDPYACMTGLGGGILWRPPAYSMLHYCSRISVVWEMRCSRT